MTEIDINIEIYCAECGAGLCNQTEATKTRRRQEPCFMVTPCKECLKREYEQGFSDGKGT